jgi:hypothetical protein
MEIKTKIADASNSVLRLLLKINKNVGNSLSSRVDALDKVTPPNHADSAKSAEKEPTFVHTIIDFAKTIYMRPTKVVNEEALTLAHERWKEQFAHYLVDKSASDFSPKNYAFEEPCELCEWLAQDGRVRWGKNPVFATLVERHAYFHEQANLIVNYTKDGEHAKAERVMDSSYRYGSNQTLLLLKKLKSLQKGQEAI